MSTVTFSKAAKFSIWFNRNYMWIICGLLFLFLFIAFLAPVLMKLQLEAPAKLIYWTYNAFCHQLAFRSWFLFGEQPFYPRQLAGFNGVLTYESITNDQKLDLFFARNFNGNIKMGYKVALCQRDTAIYASLLVCGLIFQISGRKAKALPWWSWVLIGLVPIGLDGISQFGSLGISFLSWLPVRESTPLLRTITGCAFGISTAFFLFPLIEENIQERSKSNLE